MYNWIVNAISPYLFLASKPLPISLPEPNIIPIIYLWITVAIFISRSLAIVKKLGLFLMVSEIFAGIIIGNLHYFGINIFNGIENNQIVEFLAELGAIILMFKIGLKSTLKELVQKACYNG